MQHILDPNCPFCGAAADAATIAEHGSFRALYNLSPILPGHSLVVPRWHVPSLLTLEDAEVQEMVLFSRAVVRNLTRVFKADGFNWTIQEGRSAGQTVPHLHLHLIPREDGDLPEPGDWYPRLKASEVAHIDSAERARLSADDMALIVGRIRAEWRED